MSELVDSWIFPREFVDTSRQKNLFRSKSIWFLQDLGKSLSFSQVVKSTAAVYFQRFYVFHEFKQHDRYTVAMACLFLASKVEERAVKVKDIVDAYYAVLEKPVPDEENITNLSKEVILKERILLNTLNFDLSVTHPYEFCQKKLKELRVHMQPDVNPKELLESMYSLINDIYCITLCLRHTPQHIAVAAFYVATIQLNVRPASVRGGSDRNWIDFLESDIDIQLLREICMEILNFYDQKVHHIVDRDRILSEVVGSHIHTVSNSNTPSFTVNNPLVDKDESEVVTVVEKSVTDSIVGSGDVSFKRMGSVSPTPAIPMDGSESVVSMVMGFSDFDTPRHNSNQNQFQETPSWTPRFEDTPKVARERSNSFNEYITSDYKRHRCE